MDAITVKGLRKRYGDHWWSRSRTGFRAHPGAGEQQSQLDAVGGIDLSVGRGEIFALLGPNGAGKTTTVEILEGHRFRDDGDVEVLGEDPGKAGRHWRARIGIVLQTVSDAAELTVRETVRHFAKYYPESRN